MARANGNTSFDPYILSKLSRHADKEFFIVFCFNFM